MLTWRDAADLFPAWAIRGQVLGALTLLLQILIFDAATIEFLAGLQLSLAKGAANWTVKETKGENITEGTFM